MAVSDVIQFEGPVDVLIWKHPSENFNTTSQLIVDETHEALLFVNGNAADLFPPGRRTLSVENLPLLKSFINIPTGGQTPFPCKVFFLNKVHQMDLLWGTQGSITLNDPLYEIFLHVGACGSMTIRIADSRKFILKNSGLHERFDSENLIKHFRGIISTHVKDCMSKIMINGMISYFVMNAHLFEISEEIKKRLDKIFESYGIEIVYFNMETITVPEDDYEQISKAKESRAQRITEGYSWQEERQMAIAEKFAGNEGTMGSIGGAVGGFMMGGVFGGSISELARNAMSPDKIPAQRPPNDLSGQISPFDDKAPKPFSVPDFFNPIPAAEQNTESAPLKDKPEITADPATSSSPLPASHSQPQEPEAELHPEPDAPSPSVAQHTAQQPLKPSENGRSCPNCQKKLAPDMVFCPYCGSRMPSVCPNCGVQLAEEALFCHKCGTKCI